MPQQLDQFGVQMIADVLGHDFSCLTIFRIDSDFDQLMMVQRQPDFRQDSFCDTTLAGQNDRLEMVRANSQVTFLGGFH